MTLLELLVQELPKRGGWPKDACEAYWHLGHSRPCFYTEDERLSSYDRVATEGLNLIGVEFEPDESNNSGQTVTKKLYEEALAALKNTEWNGEGLPPVGCECEALYDTCDKSWFRAKIIAHDDKRIIGRWLEGVKANQLLDYPVIDNFRPIRTDADRKREETIEDLQVALGHAHGLFDLHLLYNALKSGNIRHINLN